MTSNNINENMVKPLINIKEKIRKNKRIIERITRGIKIKI
jgi:hypothetical protein